ncbi:MAG: replication-relaxation family protein [Pirellulales bacterium]
MLTARDIGILTDVNNYYVMSRVQIQRLRFSLDKTGRLTRRRLQQLVSEGFLNRLRPMVCYPSSSPAPVYYPARRGCEFLAEHTGDERYLGTPTLAPIPHHILHWLQVTETHLALDKALSGHDQVRVEDWINEWDIVNKDEAIPEKRFRLYTLIRENPRLVCAPDAGFLLSAYGHSKVFYLEQDRGTSGVRQVANGKTPGYAALAERKLQTRHFRASASEFSVLLIAPTARRRDLLRAAIAEKPCAHLWRFAAEPDVTPDKIVFEPVWYACGKSDPMPLVKKGADA